MYTATPFPVSDPAMLDEVRQLNRKLDRMPRLKIRRRADVMLIQSILRLGQMRANWAMRRAGLTLERRELGAGGVSVRILRPAGPVRGVVLDVHGGGWVMGNARMNDQLNLGMIRACGVAVVSVDYRLAWEIPLGLLIEDCVAAARWLLDGGLPEYRDLPVIVVGESAGGHLATAMLQRLTVWPELLRRVAGALLYYGVYDFAGTPSVHRAGPETLLLDGPGLVTDLGRLTPGLTPAERRQPELSPLYGALDAMPPALMVVGALDPLLDDTLLMAEAWRNAGPAAELVLVPESPHGFIHFRSRLGQAVLRHCHGWITGRLDAAPGICGA